MDEDDEKELLEDFTDYVNILPKCLQEPFEKRKGDPDKLVNQYIGILPILSVRKYKDNIKDKDVYSQYRKNYLSDLTKLVETYFPPLKVIILPAVQVTNYAVESTKPPKISTTVTKD